MPTTAHKTLLSEVQVEISSTLTAVPGLSGFELDPGENVTVEKPDLTSDFNEKFGTGVQDGGMLKGQIVWDPLSPEHQFLHARFNDNAEVTGNVVIGATGVELPVTFTVKKFPIKAELKDAYRVEFEGELTDRVTLNEADPV
jgi:hypothetical protein